MSALSSALSTASLGRQGAGTGGPASKAASPAAKPTPTMLVARRAGSGSGSGILGGFRKKGGRTAPGLTGGGALSSTADGIDDPDDIPLKIEELKAAMAHQGR